MIDHAIGDAALQKPINLTHKQERRPRNRIDRSARDMRSEQHVVHRKQRIVRSKRFAVVYIECSTCHAALLQRLGQRRLIDQPHRARC